MIEQKQRQPMRLGRLREDKINETFDNFLHQIESIIKDRKGDICGKLLPSDYTEELSKVCLYNGSSGDTCKYFNLSFIILGFVKLGMSTSFNDIYSSSQKPKVLEKWLEKTRTQEEKDVFESFCKEREIKVKSPNELSEEDCMAYEEELNDYFDFEVEATVQVSFSDLKENGSYECQIESWYEFQPPKDSYKLKTFEIPFAELETETGRKAILDKIEKYLLYVCDL